MEAPRAEGGTSVSTPVLKDTLLVELRVMGKASKLVTCEQGSFWNLVRVFRQEFPHELLQVLDTFFDHNDDPAFEAASENVYNSFRRAFYLHHPTYHIGYEDFDMSDLRDHSVLTVSERLFHLAYAQWLEELLGSTNQDKEDQEEDDEAAHSGRRLSGSPTMTQRWRQDAWLFLETPSSSWAASVFMLASTIIILYSTIMFCAETVHGVYSPDRSTSSWLFVSEAMCIAFFTLEAVLRMLCCPDLGNYLSDAANIVDLCAIVPFYLELGLSGIPGLAVLRVVRLVRVLRIFKVSRGSATVLVVTIRGSMRPLGMLMGLTMIAVTVFSSIFYYAERGQYNDDFKVWERSEGYLCEWRVHSGENPLGRTVHPCWLREPQATQPNQTMWICPYRWPRGDNCWRLWVQSPFESIPSIMPWVFNTMVTVGYGVDVPILNMGYTMGAGVVIFGMLVIALPITVIGSNFAAVYDKLGD